MNSSERGARDDMDDAEQVAGSDSVFVPDGGMLVTAEGLNVRAVSREPSRPLPDFLFRSSGVRAGGFYERRSCLVTTLALTW